VATYYVWNGGSGAGGTTWATAYTTLTLAFASKAAGDVFFVAHDHAESTASAVTLTTPGTAIAPCFVYCVNRAGSVPPVSADLRTTATVSTTLASFIAFGLGVAYYYGIKFLAGSSTSLANLTLVSSSNSTNTFQSCAFTCNTTNASSRLNFNSSSGGANIKVTCLDCTFSFGAVAQGFATSPSGSIVRVIGGSVTGATIPTTLVTSFDTMEMIGVDLSALGSGKTLVAGAAGGARLLLQDCKLGASVTVAATPSTPQQEVHLVRCDSGDTNYRQEKYLYTGTMTTETTIVRTGGASDGTTPIAWKIVTTANSRWVMPFECPPRAIWNDTTGSRTVTIYGVWGGGAVPLNDDIWIEVFYLGTSGFPISSVATTTKADNLATGTNTTSDSSTWGGSTTKFKMSATFTANEKGPIYVTVKAAKVSSTFYVDPEIALT